MAGHSPEALKSELLSVKRVVPPAQALHFEWVASCKFFAKPCKGFVLSRDMREAFILRIHEESEPEEKADLILPKETRQIPFLRCYLPDHVKRGNMGHILYGLAPYSAFLLPAD